MFARHFQMYLLLNLLVVFAIQITPTLASTPPGLVPIEQVPALNSPDAIQLIPFPDAKYVRESQAPLFERYVFEGRRIKKREAEAADSLYTYTFNVPKRLYEWDSSSLSLLKRYTGWTLPIGVTYSESTNTTTIATLADPDQVTNITIRLFNSPFDNEPQRYFNVSHSECDDILIWKVSIPGNLEGLFYDFEFTPKPGAVSAKGEPILEKYIVADPTAYKVVNKKAQIWYPPAHEYRPKRFIGDNTTSLPSITLELDLSDMNPLDISESARGTAAAIFQSSKLQEMIAPFNEVELMPARTSVLFDGITSDWINKPLLQDVIYVHYWGYMPQSFAVANARGGPDGMFALIDFLHSKGLKVRKDEVLQHFANRLKFNDEMLNLFYFGLKGIFRGDDITGCGNTTNLQPGSTFTKLSFQMLIRDIMIFKFDGHRHDLMGAIPRNTADEIRKLNEMLGANISGEPYAVPYEKSEWNTDNNPLRRAGLWDHQYKDNIRNLAKFGGPWEQLVRWISGGHITTWANTSADRTAIVETHDNTTLAYFINRYANDYKKIANGLGMLLSSQGSVLIAASQLAAINYHSLDNTPIDVFNLTASQDVFRRFALNFVSVRKQLNDFFAYPWLEEGKNVNYLRTSNGNAIGVLLRKPAIGNSTRELLMLFNNSFGSVDFRIPSGTWYPIVDTSALKASLEVSIYPPAQEGSYNVGPFTTVWLIK